MFVQGRLEKKSTQIWALCVLAYGLTVCNTAAAEPNLCAPSKPEFLAKANKSELVGKFCVALVTGRLAMEEETVISQKLNADKLSTSEQADLLSKGMFRTAERKVCLKTALALREAIISRFGAEPKCWPPQ